MPFDIIPHIDSLGTAGFLIIGFFLLLWLFRFFYVTVFYGRLAIRKPIPAGSASRPVTILIAERNEEERLRKNLPGWLQMGYPDYEILVVDDFSEDNSLASLALMKNQFPRLKFTSLNQETRYSDKLARNIGLKAASHDLVVISHPAMVTPDNHWLPGISAAAAAGRDIVIGYSNILPSKGFRNKLFRAESFFQQMESLSASITGLPYVTSEENVTFRKGSYFETGGLAGKIREEYLNLEMVVNSIIRRGNTAVLPAGNLSLRKDIPVDSDTLRDLFNKSFRLRQYLPGGARRLVQMARLTGMLLLPMALLTLVLYPWSWFWLAVLMFLKSVVYLLIINKLLKKFHEPELFVYSLMYAIVAPCYRSIAQWKFHKTRKRRK